MHCHSFSNPVRKLISKQIRTQVRKLIIPISIGCLLMSFTLLPSGDTISDANPMATSPESKDSAATLSANTALCIYNSIEGDEYGLSQEAFLYAWKGYQHLLEKGVISQAQYLTICDFSQPSDHKRLYILDIANEKLVLNTYVAHGRNSGGMYASHFSNKAESLQSSLGFYITGGTYTGKNGLSLRMEGVDPGFNDKAMERTIVLHGAEYVNERRGEAGVMMGRSWGCPAVPQQENAFIITTIKNGTCLFIYHPEQNYLQKSAVLNG